MSAAFARATAMMALIASAMASGVPFNGQYVSRGHGEGCRGNKHAKSSFKQNKRRGL